MSGIDSDYLVTWGHNRLAAEMYQRLQADHRTTRGPRAQARPKKKPRHLATGTSSARFTFRHRPVWQALTFFRQNNARWDEGVCLGNLATCYYVVGELTQTIDFVQQALTIARQTGDRQGEVNNLGVLGICRHDLGQLTGAIELQDQALTIARQIGDRAGEATALGNLGEVYGNLGQTARAIDLYEQALAIARQIGYRFAESMDLANMAQAHGDLGSWDQAARYSREAIDIADAIGSAQAQSGARRILALIQLLAGDLAAARQAISAARDHDYPTDRAPLPLLSAIIWLRQDRPAAAAEEFQEAIAQAGQQLEQDSGDYAALDTKALALCGLALTTEPGKSAEACTVFRAARAITSAEGIVRRTRALFDALAAADPGGILAGTRQAVEAADFRQ